MSKKKTSYVCQKCGQISIQWTGQCHGCQSFNTLVEKEPEPTTKSSWHYAQSQTQEITSYDQVIVEKLTRFHSGNSELDRVLGGGFVPGSVIVLSGDPGVGKSTLTLQTVSFLSTLKSCLYVSGEESLSQIKLRGERLKITEANFSLLTQTSLEKLMHALENFRPDFIIIDSIQTLASELIDHAPGSITQIRQCAHRLTQYSKQHHCTTLLIGHVNKEGALAGPKVFEHMVDTVMHLESDDEGRYRLLRAAKNRFGPVNELGILSMQPTGLKPVTHPSALFTSSQSGESFGSVLCALWEGSRCLLVEIQSLVVDSPGFQARRLVVGYDVSRLNMLLAVLSRVNDLQVARLDVYLNIVGGLKVHETAADLALLAALYSSFKKIPLSKETLFFGEIGLSGEIRPVQYAQQRVQAAKKHGIKKIFLPYNNKAGLKDDPACVFVKNIQEFIDYIA